MLESLTRDRKKREVRLGEPLDGLFYYLDFDERSYSVNMEFQHFHAFYEMCILLGEEAAHLIEGQSYGLRMYDIVCLRPGLLHKTQYFDGPPQQRLIINFSWPEVFSEFLPEQRQLLSLFDRQMPIYRFAEGIRQEIFAPLNQIFTGRAASDVDRLRLHQWFVDFLTQLYLHRAKNQYHDTEKATELSEKIYDICACIHANYHEPLSLETLAQRFYISPYYLSRQFKQVTQFGLTEYIQRTRIRNAQQALMFSDAQITQIAQDCGFKSFSQFNRVFQKHCGLCPSQYRKENRPLYENQLRL